MNPRHWLRRHARWRSLVDLAAGDALDGPARRRLDAHLATCAACRQQLDQTRVLRRALAASVPEAAPRRSFALTPEMAARPAAASAAVPVRRPARVAIVLQGAGVAAAVAALGVLAFDLGTSGSPGSGGVQTAAIEAPAPGGGAIEEMEITDAGDGALTDPDGQGGDDAANTVPGPPPVADDAAGGQGAGPPAGGDPELAEGTERTGEASPASDEISTILFASDDGGGSDGLLITEVVLGALAALALAGGLALHRNTRRLS